MVCFVYYARVITRHVHKVGGFVDGKFLKNSAGYSLLLNNKKCSGIHFYLSDDRSLLWLYNFPERVITFRAVLRCWMVVIHADFGEFPAEDLGENFGLSESWIGHLLLIRTIRCVNFLEFAELRFVCGILLLLQGDGLEVWRWWEYELVFFVLLLVLVLNGLWYGQYKLLSKWY